MSTISPIQMRRIARDLMNDAVNGRENRASRNDGEILARMAKTGTTSIAGLDAAIDEIEKSALPLDHKKEALRVLERFKADNATGFGAELFSVDDDFMRRLAYHGVDDGAKLLTSGATTAKREHLAQQVGSDEKEIRRLVKQADLMRVDGVDGKTAHVLLGAGIDSVPELGSRNADNLHQKLVDFAKSQEGYVVSFNAPSLDEVKAWVAQAGGLNRVVEFGSAEDSFGSLSLQERVSLFLNQGAPLSFRDYDGGLIKLMNDLKIPNAMPAISAMRSNAADDVSTELDVWDINVSSSVIEGLSDYDALIEWVSENIGSDEADNLGNGWAEWKNPNIELIKSGRDLVGAKISFSRSIDGDHDYYSEYFVDAKEARVVAMTRGGYEMDTEIEDVGPGEALSGSPTTKRLEDLVATGIESVQVGGQKLDVWATSIDDDGVGLDAFKAAVYIRHDNVSTRPFGDNSDALVTELTTGLSAAKKKKVEDGIAFMRANLTNLTVLEATGGSFGDEAHTGVYLAGRDDAGALVYLRMVRETEAG